MSREQDTSRQFLVYRLTQMADGGPLAFDAELVREAIAALTASPQAAPEGGDAEATALRLLCDISQDVLPLDPALSEKMIATVGVLCTAYRRRLASPQAAPVLDRPARVAGRDFMPGQPIEQVLGRAYAHYDAQHGSPQVQGVASDDELPGMWARSDLIGGKSDYDEMRAGAAVTPQRALDEAMVERALTSRARREDGAIWPDDYSAEEQAAERENMRATLCDALNEKGPAAYCRGCQRAGLRHCSNFDECDGATCITCHRPLNAALASGPSGVDG